MPLIYHGLIIDDKKEELPKDSFLKLRTTLLNLLYPMEQKRLITRDVDNTSSTKYVSITEYKKEIEKRLAGYVHVCKLRKQNVLISLKITS